MILIADSGSTSTSWRLCDPSGMILQYRTEGLNPYFVSEEEMQESIRKQLLSFPGFPESEAITSVFFYGSGCSSDEKKNQVHQSLTGIFSAASIEVESDLLGAARGTCGHQPGLAAILGTGSNSCQYDGEKITHSRPSLGFILGDEGSGAYFGKKLLQAFYYDEMPANIQLALQKKTGNNRSAVLENIYKKPFPNRYIASYARFIQHHIKDPWCKKLVYDGFTEFIEKHILHYDVKNHSLNVSGSVGFYFGQILTQAAKDKEIKMGTIVESPVAGLVLYHLGEI